MSNLPIFDVAGSAMTAQSVRLSTIASNLANAPLRPVNGRRKTPRLAASGTPLA